MLHLIREKRMAVSTLEPSGEIEEGLVVQFSPLDILTQNQKDKSYIRGESIVVYTVRLSVSLTGSKARSYFRRSGPIRVDRVY